MAADLLHQPLGQDRRPGGPKQPSPRRRWLVGLGVVAVVLVAAALWFGVKPLSSPHESVVAKIEPAKVVPSEPLPVPPAPPKATLSAGEVETSSGVNVVRPPGTAPGGAQILTVPQDLAVSLQPAPDPRLIEKTRFGLLPRRGADGARPSDVYARPVIIDGTLPARAPRIALMVGGMGLNPGLTSAAVQALPPAVTLGFAPYGDDLDHQVQAARGTGHEVLLQAPMEGFGDPAASTMSHLLATGLDGKELLDRLHWLMCRFTGYAGIANFLGGKFTADDAAFAPVLRDVAGRGLFYFDDGSSPRSLAPGLAASLNLPMVQADVVLDASSDPKAIDDALGRLQTRASERGTAVGVASGLPASISRIADFAQKLGDHGFALVPVSALAALQPAPAAKMAQP